ncbi:MAG TPA: phenylpyruvate tautomerase MIF-related protein [Polyangiaceae bacterium]
MPLVRIVSNHPAVAESQSQALLSAISRCTCRILNKPESYVMTCLEPTAVMTFGGSADPTCYIEVKNVGALNSSVTRQLTEELCTLVSNHLRIASNRTYIEFTEADGRLWAFDGSTFG